MNLLIISGLKGTTVDPYLRLLYQPMVAQGHEVRGLGKAVTTFRHDIVHVQRIDAWNRPYEWLKKHPYNLSAAVMFLFQFLHLLWLKLLGSKIVWTIHNLYPHDSKHLKVDRTLTLLSVGLLDGWISLAESAKEMAIQEFPALASKPNQVHSLLHFRSAYPPALAKSAARAQLGLTAKDTVILYFGWIKPYKGVDSLMKTFHQLRNDAVSLVVAGGPLPKSLGEFLQKLADADDRILYMPKAQSPESTAMLFSAADLAIFPYRTFLNSGAPILSLSYGVPCLVRHAPTMIDLQKAVGPQWVRLFDDDELSLRSLEDAIAWSIGPRDQGTPDLSTFEPDLVAKDTLRFYEEVLAK